MTVDVSVVIAAYNVERYIERAVKSALDQEGIAVEVIVVDDGSADGTLKKLAGIADPRVRVLQMPENGGPGAARNKGFAAASGVWIAVLDGDDAFESGRLARCLARGAAAGADIVVDNLLVCPEDDATSYPMFSPGRLAALDPLSLAAFIDGKAGRSGGYTLGYLKPVFSAAFLSRNGLSYPVDIRIGEDYFMMAEALARGAVCVVEPETGYLYTARAGSISHRVSPADIDRMLESDRRFLARHGLSPGAARAQRSRTRALKEMRGWEDLAASIKERNPAAILCAVARSPSSVFHLWKPLLARLRRQGEKA